MNEQRKLFVKEIYRNASEMHLIGESDVYETFTSSPGKLFRAYRSEFGRCTGSAYVGTPNSAIRKVGWIFEKRVRYEDSNDTYLREVFVELHDAPPTTITIEQFHYLDE